MSTSSVTIIDLSQTVGKHIAWQSKQRSVSHGLFFIVIFMLSDGNFSLSCFFFLFFSFSFCSLPIFSFVFRSAIHFSVFQLFTLYTYSLNIIGDLNNIDDYSLSMEAWDKFQQFFVPSRCTAPFCATNLKRLSTNENFQLNTKKVVTSSWESDLMLAMVWHEYEVVSTD